MIAEVIPIQRLKRQLGVFDYAVPDEASRLFKPGQLVQVSFRQKKIDGLIWRLKTHSLLSADRLVKIEKLRYPSPIINNYQAELVSWAADRYFCSPSLIAKTFLPSPPKKSTRSISAPSLYLKGVNHLPGDQNNKLLGISLIKELTASNKGVSWSWRTSNERLSVYHQLIDYFCGDGQLAIIFPTYDEIAKFILTLVNVKSENLAILHKDLNAGQYWQEWLKVLTGQAKLVVGTRSAVWAPFSRLKYIIIDQEESADHKQYDQNPRYRTHDVAEWLKLKTGCHLLYAAAAPRLNTWYLTKTDKTRALSSPPAEFNTSISIFDIRHQPIFNFNLENAISQTLADGRLAGHSPERSRGGDSRLAGHSLGHTSPRLRVASDGRLAGHSLGHTSPRLRVASEGRLAGHSPGDGRQCLLILNRRGAAALWQCQDCGFVSLCPRCQAPMSAEGKQLVCRHCRTTAAMLLTCPKCDSVNVKLIGYGLERLESDLKKTLSQAGIARHDYGAPLKTATLKNADIILGTMGLLNLYQPSHNKKIGLLAFVNIDNWLLLPDYRAPEITWQILNKAKIYCRDHSIPRLIIQTRLPNHHALQSLGLVPRSLDEEGLVPRSLDEEGLVPRSLDEEGQKSSDHFYQTELTARQKLNYPPFVTFIKCVYQHEIESNAKKEAERLFNQLKNILPVTTLDGPYPAYPPKIRRNWRWQIIIRYQNKLDDELKKILVNLPSEWLIDHDPEFLN